MKPLHYFISGFIAVVVAKTLKGLLNGFGLASLIPGGL
jgi:hypothetical protein